MQLSPTFKTLAAHNAHNQADFLEQLELAQGEAQTAGLPEPRAARCLRLHLSGRDRLLSYKFETAYKVHPAARVQFAEALFTLQDEQNQRIPSPEVLRMLQTYAPSRRLDSRFRFWLGFHAASDFFAKAGRNSSHLSLNIPAYAVASPYFQARLTNALTLLKQDHPDKGLILEMLEHQPWNDAQRKNMQQLKEHEIGWAVDDYGAPDGHHGPRSLQLAAEYSGAMPPLVKIDGGLLTDCLKTQNFDKLCARVHEADRYAPGAFLVLEWVQTAAELSQIHRALAQAGCRTPVGYVQSHGFNETEQRKALTALHP